MSTVRATNFQHASSSVANLVLASDGSVSGNIPANPKNRIINGGFDIWQRGTSFASSSLFQYTADRWFGNSFAGVTTTISQQAFTPGQSSTFGVEPQFFLRFARGAGTVTSVSYLTQRIEDVRTFAGQTVTVSFWAKLASSGDVIVKLDQNFGSGGSATAFGSGTTIAVGTSWARYAATIAVPSVSGKTIGTSSYLDFIFTFPQALGNCTFDVWGVQVEAGTAPTAFEFKSYGQELRECQRYYQRWTGGSAYSVYGFGVATTTTTASIAIQPKASMRVEPTAVETSNVAASDITNAPITTSAISIDSAVSGPDVVMLALTVSGATAYRPYALVNNNNAAGYIALSAEL